MATDPGSARGESGLMEVSLLAQAVVGPATRLGRPYLPGNRLKQVLRPTDLRFLVRKGPSGSSYLRARRRFLSQVSPFATPKPN